MLVYLCVIGHILGTTPILEYTRGASINQSFSVCLALYKAESNKTKKTFSLKLPERLFGYKAKQIGQVVANLDKFGPIWTSLIQSGQV